MKCFLLRCLLILLPCCVWGQADSSQLERWCEEGRAFARQGNTAQAIASYLKAAEQGYADAQCALHNVYLSEGRMFKAEYWLDKAVEQGTSMAYEYKGEYLYYEKNKVSEGLMYFEKAAQMDNIDAIETLLIIGHNSNDPSKWKLAKPYLSRGVQLNSSTSKAIMAFLLASGDKGVKKNPQRAKSILEELRKKDKFLADDELYNLANAYWELGGKSDKALTMDYYSRLFQHNYEEDLFAVRGYNSMENGAVEDAYYVLEMGCEQGEASSCSFLGRCYMEGRGIEVDTSRSIAYLLKAEELDSGFCYGFNNLGFYYEKGVGVKPNLKKAIDYYKKAVAGKHIYACNNLGNLYRLGKGVEQDLEKAFELYRISDKKGNLYATYNLAQCYYQGMGCEQDREYAFRLIRYCAGKGHFEANLFLAKAYVKGEPYLLKSKDKSIQHALRATYQYYTDVLWSRLGLWREKTWVY